MNEPKHLTYGTPLSECVVAFENELQIDAVGLWQVISTLRRGYGLEEVELKAQVRKVIESLFIAGAIPVFGSARDKMWHPAAGFEQQDEERTEVVLRYLHNLGRDPGVEDLWFALPKFTAGDE